MSHVWNGKHVSDRFWGKESAMDKLYICLQREIASYKTHVQQCKNTFDVGTLHSVLRALIEDHQGEIDSLEELRRRTEVPEVAEVYPGIESYISWLFSFVEHLTTMKETFDEKVVIPLSENLYVIEEVDSDRSTDGSRTSWSKLDMDKLRDPVQTSVQKVANELFILRRRWALLLAPGPIRVENFSPESTLSGEKAEMQYAKVLWLLPDILYKNSAAAHLAAQWIKLHQKNHGGRTAGGKAAQTPERTSERLISVNKTNREPPRMLACHHRQAAEAQAELRDCKMELTALGWREERARLLQQKVEEVSQRVHGLRVRLNAGRRKVEKKRHGVQWEASDEEETKGLRGAEGLANSLELEGQLRVEVFYQRILQGDLMLQLEIRPALIRQMDMIRNWCVELEEKLGAMRGSPGSRAALQAPTMLSSDSLSRVSGFPGPPCLR